MTGVALAVTFAERSITALRFTVDAVSATMRNIGRAEIEVCGADLRETVN